MIKHICYDNEIRIWWDTREDKTEDMRYKVIVDGRSYILTDRIYYDFTNLEQGREYEFELQLVDRDKNIIGRREKITLSTLEKRRVVDITKPPYNAVGDGKTDNTAAFQRAMRECAYNTTLYFPFGVYLCEKVDFSGNIQLHLDAGAVICTPQKEKEL